MEMLQLWMESIQHPGVLALLIILSTYILEDAAIISAALLSADNMIAPELAFLALVIGITSGDIGLYGLGMLLKRWHWLMRWVNADKIDEAAIWLEKRMTSTILLVRVIPGITVANLPCLRILSTAILAVFHFGDDCYRCLDRGYLYRTLFIRRYVLGRIVALEVVVNTRTNSCYHKWAETCYES